LTDVPAGADHLPYRGNCRDPLSSRRGVPHRRHLGLCGSPAEGAAREPRVSAFTSADIPKILDLQPDLVLTFSDLQADIAAELIRANVDVHAFNQRTVTQILDMIRTLGALVGAVDRADRLAAELAARISIARKHAAQMRSRPRVYFEEWDEPMISGIGWVSELIEAAGGVDVFADRASCKSAKDRIVTAEEVIRNEPEIIIGSWCGKKFRPERLAKRPGFDHIPAVKHGALHEIKSPLILQPGPAALTDGLAALQAIIANAAAMAASASR
jgi:iron complex transport system substrate-binding protein